MKKRLALILTVLWLLLIWHFSGEDGNMSSRTSGFFLTTFFPFLESCPLAELFIRKLAHFSEFGILAVLFYADLKKYHYAFGLTVLAAMTDEFHQSFVGGRSASLKDVLIDSSGALFFLVMVYVITQLLKRER